MYDPARNTFKVQDYPNQALDKPVLFHVIHITNISRSKLQQLDSWKEHANPNNVSVDRQNKSRKTQNNDRLIREVRLDEETSNLTTYSGFDTYKVLLRDSANNYCYGYETNGPLSFLRNGGIDTPLGIALGGRLVVQKGTQVQNGVLLLTRQLCDYRGIDPADKQLVDSLNDGIVQKYIDILERELKLQNGV